MSLLQDSAGRSRQDCRSSVVLVTFARCRGACRPDAIQQAAWSEGRDRRQYQRERDTMDLRLHGTYFIAGASGELGRVVAPVFRDAGAQLVLVDSRREEVEAQARALGARAVVADLCRASRCQARGTGGHVRGADRGVVAPGGGVRQACRMGGWRRPLRPAHGLQPLDPLQYRAGGPSRGCSRSVTAGAAIVATNLVWGQGSGSGMTLYAAAEGPLPTISRLWSGRSGGSESG